MRTQKSRQEIQQQNRKVLNNISQAQKTARIDELRANGHVLLSEASEKGFKKVGWDVYQRPEDVDAGNIWSVEDIEGDKWLVCYTDANDRILRNIAKEAYAHRTKKYAANVEPVVGFGLKPGDLVQITPRQSQSINYKHSDLKGTVSAAMPDRTQLRFGDGSEMWFENKDLTPITDAKEMEVGDSVRMFSNKLEGNITKFSHDKKYITFQNADTGQEFTARKNDVVLTKKAFLFMWTGITPDDTRAGQKALSDFMKSQTPQTDSMGMESQMGGNSLPPAGNKMPNGVPPSIKRSPTPDERETGSAIPASDFGTGLTPGGMPQMNQGIAQPGEMLPVSATTSQPLYKSGRRMNVGDTVQKKSTGEKGTIVDIQFDRKLGKFYLIDFGSQSPEQIYETDLMKLKDPGGNVDAMPMPSEVTPGPTRLIGASIKEAILDPVYNPIKEAASEFVHGMVSQALEIHEQENPGSKISTELENALAKQAVEVFMQKYLPPDIRQTMGADDKNALSEWLVFEFTGSDEDSPTAQEFTQGENTVMPAQTVNTSDLAGEKVRAHIASHVKYAMYNPGNFISPTEKNRFIHQAVSILTDAGIERRVAHLITASMMANSTINHPYLKHTLSTRMGYEKPAVESLIKEAAYQFATTLFTTTGNQKYALDLPGMETLRGGGGGYPGGMDIDPMGWEVKSKGDPQDPAMLEQALNEQLSNQAIPFEEAAPELNIKLDQENKQIVIDYNQEKEPVMPLENPEEGNPLLPESPNMPSATGPAGPKPGGAKGPGGNETDFSNQDVPVNF